MLTALYKGKYNVTSRIGRPSPKAHSRWINPFASGQALLRYWPSTYRSKPFWPTLVMWCIVDASGFLATRPRRVESVRKRTRAPEGC